MQVQKNIPRKTVRLLVSLMHVNFCVVRRILIGRSIKWGGNSCKMRRLELQLHAATINEIQYDDGLAFQTVYLMKERGHSLRGHSST